MFSSPLFRASRSRARILLDVLLAALALAATGCDDSAEMRQPGQLASGRDGGTPSAEAGQPGSGAAGVPPVIVLISIDTLRAGHLGLYGYERFTSPELDILARGGVVFEDASSTAPWTLPAHGSMLTGLYPSSNGVRMALTGLPEEIPTLAGLLAEAGFRTAAVVNSGWLEQKPWGLTRDFERFLWIEEKADRASSSVRVTDTAIDWLRRRGDEPIFVFMHYYDVHADYVSLPPYEKLFVEPYEGKADGTSWQLTLANVEQQFVEYCRASPEKEVCKGGAFHAESEFGASTQKVEFDESDIRHLVDLYDAQIRQLDAELGRFFRFLGQEGLMERTLLVVTSDHGEEFGEHGGTEHMRTQYEEVLRVPLVMRGPGIPENLRMGAPVSIVDIVPTILGLAGVSAAARFDGLDLSGLWRGQPGESFADRPIFAEASHGASPAMFVRALRDGVPSIWSIRRGRYKLHYNTLTGAEQLFDLESDPSEQVDLAEREPEVTRRLSAELQARRRSRSGAPEIPIEIDSEDAARLRSLGYIQ